MGRLPHVPAVAEVVFLDAWTPHSLYRHPHRRLPTASPTALSCCSTGRSATKLHAPPSASRQKTRPVEPSPYFAPPPPAGHNGPSWSALPPPRRPSWPGSVGRRLGSRTKNSAPGWRASTADRTGCWYDREAYGTLADSGSPPPQQDHLQPVSDPSTLDYVTKLLGEEKVRRHAVPMDLVHGGPSADESTTRLRPPPATSCARCHPIMALPFTPRAASPSSVSAIEPGPYRPLA